MKGQVLFFDTEKDNGVIVDDSGQRFVFTQSGWQNENPPSRGMNVDFEANAEGLAQAIYPALPTNQLAGPSFALRPKHKPTLILLAIFLGTFGAHKFYMGAWGWGIVYIIATLLFAGILTIPLVIAEWVRYILASDEEFQAKVHDYQASNPHPFSFYW